jgi:hypothetical protein
MGSPQPSHSTGAARTLEREAADSRSFKVMSALAFACSVALFASPLYAQTATQRPGARVQTPPRTPAPRQPATPQRLPAQPAAKPAWDAACEKLLELLKQQSADAAKY